MKSIDKIAKESGINFTGSVIGNLLGYIWLMIMTRFLSQEDFGSFTLAQSVVNVSLIFVMLGTPRSLDRFIPFYNSTGEQGKTKTLIRFILRFSLISSLFMGLVLFLGSDFLSRYVFSNPNLSRLLRIIVFSIPLLSVTMIVTYAFAGYKELRYHVYLKQLVEPALKIVFAAVVAIFGFGIIEWTWFYVAALLLTAIIGIWFLITRILGPLSDVPSVSINFQEIITYSWPISIASILMIIIGQIAYLILGIYQPAADVGIFRIYIYIAAFLKLILGSVARIYKPVISELIPKENYLEIKDTYRRISKWVLSMTILGFLIILLYGNRLVGLLFTDAYAVYPLALSILALGTFLNAAFGPEGMTLEAFGNTKLVLINSLIMLIINAGLGFLLIPNYGIVGAAIATATALTVGGFVGFVEIYILYQMQPFTQETLKFLLIGMITGGLFYSLDRWLMADSIFVLLIMIFLMIAGYFAGLLRTSSFDKTDREIFNKIIKKITPLK
jgi:O-antigen/teichoic acid export membrane protein